MSKAKLKDTARQHRNYASDRPVIPGTSLKYELY